MLVAFGREEFKFMNIFDGWKKKIAAAVEEEDEEITFKSFDEEVNEEKVEDVAEESEEFAVRKSSIEGNNIELKIVRPENMNEIFTIADYLIDGCTVVLNLELLDKDTIKRMLDFLNGVIYTKGGDMENVSPGTYIITPTGINIDNKQ